MTQFGVNDASLIHKTTLLGFSHALNISQCQNSDSQFRSTTKISKIKLE